MGGGEVRGLEKSPHCVAPPPPGVGWGPKKNPGYERICFGPKPQLRARERSILTYKMQRLHQRNKKAIAALGFGSGDGVGKGDVVGASAVETCGDVHTARARDPKATAVRRSGPTTKSPFLGKSVAAKSKDTGLI